MERRSSVGDAWPWSDLGAVALGAGVDTDGDMSFMLQFRHVAHLADMHGKSSLRRGGSQCWCAPASVLVFVVTTPAYDNNFTVDYDGHRKVIVRVSPSRSGG